MLRDQYVRFTCIEVKDHPYFSDVKFQLLKNQIPPIIPTPNNKLSNTNNIIDDSTIIDSSTLEDNNIWKNFKDFKR